MPKPPTTTKIIKWSSTTEVVKWSEELAQKSQTFDNAVVSPATRRAYTADLKHFGEWLTQHGLPATLPIPPTTIAAYLTDQAGTLKPSTLERRLAAIAAYHKQSGFDPPTRSVLVQNRLKGIRRTVGSKQDQKAAVKQELLEKVLATVDDTTLRGLRDRSLLLTGFTGGFRRSEYVRVRLDHLDILPDRVVVHLDRSKTDQEGRGRKVVLIKHPDRPDLCPINALNRWLRFANITSGSVYRSFSRDGQRVLDHPPEDGVVNEILKEAVKKCGLDPNRFGSHSLRAGFVTDALAHGAEFGEVMAQTGHKSVSTVLKYRRETDPLLGNAVAKLWNRKEPKK